MKRFTGLFLSCSLLIPAAQAADICQPASGLPIDAENPMPNPYGCESVWKKPIPDDAVYADIQGALDLFSDSHPSPDEHIASLRPTNLSLDLITICLSGTSGVTNTDITKNLDWAPELRQQVEPGAARYPIELTDDACSDVNLKPGGNGLVNVVNPLTGKGSQHVGAWRIPGGELLTYHGAHPDSLYDFMNDKYGIEGFGRASKLPSLGGAIRLGELQNGINHVVAIAMPEQAFSADRHYLWPASGADKFAGEAGHSGQYQGRNPNYAMGTLMALPKHLSFTEATFQSGLMGYNLAKSAQDYGWYVVDASGFKLHTGGQAAPTATLAIESKAAQQDIGLNPQGDIQHGLRDKLTADVLLILKHMKAVVSNPIYPDLASENLSSSEEALLMPISSGSRLTFTAGVNNKGPVVADNAVVYHALSRNGEILLETKTAAPVANPTLYPGQESTFDVDVNFSRHLPVVDGNGVPFNYELIGHILEPGNKDAENVEDRRVKDAYPKDNFGTLARLDVRAPDLSMDADGLTLAMNGAPVGMQDEIMLLAGDAVHFSVNVNNIGDSWSADGVEIGFYVSTTPEISTSSLLFATYTLSMMEPKGLQQAVATLSVTETMAQNFSGGPYYFGAIVDVNSDHNFAEWSKDNNLATSAAKVFINGN